MESYTSFMEMRSVSSVSAVRSVRISDLRQSRLLLSLIFGTVIVDFCKVRAVERIVLWDLHD